jgi:hypothetical protein
MLEPAWAARCLYRGEQGDAGRQAAADVLSIASEEKHGLRGLKAAANPGANVQANSR